MKRHQRTHQRKRRFSCLACGEPWSSRAVNHQPMCSARKGLQSRDPMEVAATVETYRKDFDALGRYPEGGE